MVKRNIDDIDQEIEYLMSLTENGGGFGDPDAKEAYDKKIQILLNLRQQEIIKNNSISEQGSQLPELGVLDERMRAGLADSFGYVSVTRIQELKAIKSRRVDLTKLIRLCEELNIAHANDLNLATAMLLRATLDHVPPIFAKASFKEVASGCGGKSFKEIMQRLDKGARKIADYHLHAQIRIKEVLPNRVQVNISQDLDFLLAEVIAILQAEEA